MPALALATLDEPRCPLLAKRPRRRRRWLHVVADNPPDPEKHAGPAEAGPNVSAWGAGGCKISSNAGWPRLDVLARSAQRRAERLATYTLPSGRRLCADDHLGLVRMVAGRYPVPTGWDFDDLVHAGVIGLIDAVAKFDPAKGTTFSTYAVPRIQSAISRWLDTAPAIYVPERKRQAIRAARRGDAPMTDELARIDGLGRVLSLDKVYEAEDGSTTLLDVVDRLRSANVIARGDPLYRTWQAMRGRPGQ